MTNDQNVVRARHIESLAADAKRFTLEQNLALNQAVQAELEGIGEYTAGYGLSLADNEFSVTLQGGNTTTFDDGVVDNINKFFKPRVELQNRYARAPFDDANICNLDLSHLIDGENFELDTENLTDGQVTRIRSGSASYHVNNGISRGYVEVKTICKCTVTVVYSISSQASYDYGGCIVTENAPNTTFTYANLQSANFFYTSGSYANQTKTYTLDANKTYYLNFGYAKSSNTNSNDDRFYIHSITVAPNYAGDCLAENFFLGTSDVADCIVSGIGGKFYPSLETAQDFLEFGAASQLDGVYAKLIEGKSYDVSMHSSKTFWGGNCTVSINGDDSSSTKYSLVSAQNGTTQYVTLPSSTSNYAYDYSVVKLTESGGFITRDQYYDGYRGTFYVQPFVITADGKPSLGTNTSIMSAQSSSYPNSSVSMDRSIFNPLNIMFFCEQDTSSGTDYKYTTIEFQGIGTGLTRVKALTTLGTDYSNYYGKTCTELNNEPNRALIKKFNRGNRSFSISAAGYGTSRYFPFWAYRLSTYNSSGSLTATKRYFLINHGLYRTAPITLCYYDDTTGLDKSFAPDIPRFLGVWRSRKMPGTCYFAYLPQDTYTVRGDNWLTISHDVVDFMTGNWWTVENVTDFSDYDL